MERWRSNELVTMVGIALGASGVEACVEGDRDGNGQITIAELIAAVGYALTACPTPRIELQHPAGADRDARCARGHTQRHPRLTAPVQSNWLADVAANTQRTLDLIFASCAADQSCAAVYPDLEQTFFDLIDRLNREPVTLQGTDPATGEPITVVVTGDRLGSNPPPAIENEPVVSNIPTLVLAGEHDPITPPAYGRLAAETLSPSYFFELRGYAHGIFSPGCADDLKLAFLSDPTSPPDGSCVAARPPLRFVGTQAAAGAVQIPTITRRLPAMP